MAEKTNKQKNPNHSSFTNNSIHKAGVKDKMLQCQEIKNKRGQEEGAKRSERLQE